MKLNLKAWFGALSMLLVSSSAYALEEPTFSTTDSPVWYQVKFTSSGNVLQANTVLKTAAATENGEDCMWQLIGNADSFVLLSQSGKYLNKGSNVNYRGNSSNYVELKLTNVGDAWEISRVGETTALTQKNTNTGSTIIDGETGADNNKVLFVIPSDPEGFPTFSEEGGEETWYFLQFTNGGHIIYDMGLNTNCKHLSASPDRTDNQWKLVGTSSNFQLVNKDGHYANGSGDRLTTTTEAYSAGFSLVAVEADGSTCQIKNNGLSNGYEYFNMYGGVNATAAEIGFWSSGDSGNTICFVLPEDYEYEEVNDIVGSTTFKPEQPLSLWYTRPSSTATDTHKWMDLGLPIGNGQLGAMVLGNVLKEDISVNEKTLWSGDTELRGSYNYGCYQNFGSLYVRTNEEGIAVDKQVCNYWRDLDLTTGLARVHYENTDGVSYDRKYIASYPDNVVAALFTTDKSGALSLNFEEVPGMAKNHTVSYSVEGNVATIEYHGKLDIVSYCSVIKIIPTGETAQIALAEDGQSVDVSNADQVYVVIAAGTDYDATDLSYTSGTDALQSNMETIAANALTKGWDSVLADQQADHSALFDRVSFTLDGAANEMPTDEMRTYYSSLTSSAINSNDPAVKMLEMLYFHYGRYLEIGSSRGVDLPGNLQGIWSGYNVYVPHASYQVVPWNGDIHSNINVQMCYWPCEPTNLSELHLPFLNYIINQATIQPQWRYFAHNTSSPAAVDEDAWTCAVENNIFGGMGNYDTKYSVANAWYCTHLWQHYAYTLDKEFLTRALPTMWGAVKFWFDRMIVASDGTYECPSESSPEHGPNENGVAHAQQIVAELFSNVLAAVEALPEQTVIDADGIAKLQKYYNKMDKGLAIEQFKTSSGWTANGLSDGDDLLREWKYSSYTSGADQHRHISHLMCLYPYAQVEPGTREFNAAVNSLQQRGDGATGWSIGWKINLWARAFDGDHARLILRNGLSNNTYNNLFDSHSPYQIDGNFGACTGISEMLVQSRQGTIWVLPALPTLWTNGEINGLKAEGDFTIDIKWADSKITLATITANQGGTLNLGNNDLVNTHIEVNGVVTEPIVYTNAATGLITTTVAGLNAGDKVTLVYDATYTQPNVQEKEVEDSIAEIAAADTMDVSVSNGSVIVSGAEVAEICVYDLSGRAIAHTTSNTLTFNAEGVIIVKVIDVNGNVKTVKAAI